MEVETPTPSEQAKVLLFVFAIHMHLFFIIVRRIVFTRQSQRQIVAQLCS